VAQSVVGGTSAGVGESREVQWGSQLLLVVALVLGQGSQERYSGGVSCCWHYCWGRGVSRGTVGESVVGGTSAGVGGHERYSGGVSCYRH
jgi:hypothetical protein